MNMSGAGRAVNRNVSDRVPLGSGSRGTSGRSEVQESPCAGVERGNRRLREAGSAVTDMEGGRGRGGRGLGADKNKNNPESGKEDTPRWMTRVTVYTGKLAHIGERVSAERELEALGYTTLFQSRVFEKEKKDFVRQLGDNSLLLPCEECRNLGTEVDCKLGSSGMSVKCFPCKDTTFYAGYEPHVAHSLTSYVEKPHFLGGKAKNIVANAWATYLRGRIQNLDLQEQPTKPEVPPMPDSHKRPRFDSTEEALEEGDFYQNCSYSPSASKRMKVEDASVGTSELKSPEKEKEDNEKLKNTFRRRQQGPQSTTLSRVYDPVSSKPIMFKDEPENKFLVPSEVASPSTQLSRGSYFVDSSAPGFPDTFPSDHNPSQLNLMKARLTFAQSACEIYLKELGTLTSEKDLMASKNCSVQKERDAVRGEKEVLNERVLELEAGNVKLRTEFEQMRQCVKELQKSLKDTERKREQLLDEQGGLQASIQGLQNLLSAERGGKAEAEVKLKETQEELATLRVEVENLHGMLQQVPQPLSQGDDDVQLLKDNLAMAEGNLQTARKAAEKYEHEYQAVIASRDALQVSYDHLEKSYREFRSATVDFREGVSVVRDLLGAFPPEMASARNAALTLGTLGSRLNTSLVDISTRLF